MNALPAKLVVDTIAHLLAAEALFLGAPVAHVAAYYERKRLQNINRRARAAFVAAHGEMPNAPLSRDRCDRLAGGNPEIRGALIRMFGAPVKKLEG